MTTSTDTPQRRAENKAIYELEWIRDRLNVLAEENPFQLCNGLLADAAKSCTSALAEWKHEERSLRNEP